MTRPHVLAAAALVAAIASACNLVTLAECQNDSECNGRDFCDDGVCVECGNDSDCDDDEECDDGDCENVGEGEGEGDVGEGEGEGGEGEGECDLGAFANPSGNGLVASAATLEPDTSGNIAGCADPTDAFFLVLTIDSGGAITATDFDDVRFSVAGGSLELCDAPGGAFEDLVVCPVCFDPVPAELAAQFDNGLDASNAVCVDTSGS